MLGVQPGEGAAVATWTVQPRGCIACSLICKAFASGHNTYLAAMIVVTSQWVCPTQRSQSARLRSTSCWLPFPNGQHEQLKCHASLGLATSAPCS